jgi:hypothetical protein
MTSRRAPNPMRVLIGWSNAAFDLRQALLPLRPAVETLVVGSTEVEAYLVEANYYHILCFSPIDWLHLTARQRRKFAIRVNLLVLGPDPFASPADLDATRTSVYLPKALPLEQVVKQVAEMSNRLVLSQSLTDCISASAGALTLIGGVDCWPEAGSPQTQPEPAAQANPSPAPQSTATPNSTAVEQVTIKGDFRMGTTSIHTNGGAIVEGNVYTNGGKFVGRDDQSGPEAPVQKICPTCHTKNEPQSNYCHLCGQQFAN